MSQLTLEGNDYDVTSIAYSPKTLKLLLSGLFRVSYGENERERIGFWDKRPKYGLRLTQT